ncbi:NADH:flavin oxidoreductase [Undibacterium sp. TJN19]|uniref:NADH:flavin oxidoreductase n=1 Tax=Undibacterium sp. TJN19 TaxID=3413055 RepID=UPI003BF04AAE
MRITNTHDTHQHDCLFEQLTIGRMALKNRLVVAPMTRVSATDDDCATERMARYYSAFAEGGFALIITEGIYTDKAYSQGYRNQPGLSDDIQRDAWAAVTDRVHQGGARIVAQLMHAGALSQGNVYRDDTVGPSAIRPKGQQMEFYRGKGDYPIPRTMTHDEIAEVICGFADAAARAKHAGFDGVEIHGANGYLLDQFLTEGTNLRNDRYGGDIERRLRLIIEVAQAIRTAVGPEFTVSLRISQGKVNDFTHKWRNAEDDAARIFGTLAKLPIDYIHTTEFEAWQSAFETGPSLAALARQHAGILVIANGSLHDPMRAADLIASGQADAISLGRGALTHADWPARVLHGAALDEFDREILFPIADLANEDKYLQRIESLSKKSLKELK